MKNRLFTRNSTIFFLAAITAFTVIISIAMPFFKPTSHAEKLLREFYTAGTNDLLKLPNDPQQLSDLWLKVYGAHMTEEGFEDAMAGRDFIRCVKKANELKSDIYPKKILLNKGDEVKDMNGRELHYYNYTVVCQVTGKQVMDMNFYGKLVLVKSNYQWLVDRIEPEF